jgi:prephenate dehydrogenase
MTKPSMGIIGFGDFSKLMIRHLEPYVDILVATRQKGAQTDLHCRFVDDAEALSQPLVIPSMPAQFLEDYFTKNAKYLHSGTMVIDVCSVKVKPVEILCRILPKEVEILATHPMFGPVSAATSLEGQRIMIYPARLEPEKYELVKHFLSGNMHLKVIETTPEEHDKVMAYVQGLSHYIGRVMDNMQIPETDLMTNAYADLLDMKKIQGADSWELFESIMFENPYALEVHDQFEKACLELDRRLSI